MDYLYCALMVFCCSFGTINQCTQFSCVVKRSFDILENILFQRNKTFYLQKIRLEKFIQNKNNNNKKIYFWVNYWFKSQTTQLLRAFWWWTLVWISSHSLDTTKGQEKKAVLIILIRIFYQSHGECKMCCNLYH